MNDPMIIKPKTYLDTHTQWADNFRAQQIGESSFSKTIEVKSPFNCWNCGKEFMSVGFETFCSEKCDERGTLNGEYERGL